MNEKTTGKSVYPKFYGLTYCEVILVDEAQFFTSSQIDQLHDIALTLDIPVICYGLLTDFQTHLFEGSKRLIEVAESLQEIKTVCRCGRKTTVNARIVNGGVITNGEQIQLGADESYESMCYKCWLKQQLNVVGE